MRLATSASRRTGSILPLVAISLVALVGFVALAVDVGMLVVSRSQCQHAADCAAMAGARTLNGNTAANNNYSNAGPNALSAATACKVLSNPVTVNSVSYEIGYYTYNRNTNTFGAILPSSGQQMPTGENWSLVRATVTASNNSAFAKIFGVMSLNTSAVATAVHRPRDVCIIMDYSGSMSFDSLLGGDYSGNRTQSLNPDNIYPQFGHYTGYNSQTVSGQVIASGEVLGVSNTAFDTDAGSAIVNDFYQNALGAAPVAAFSPADNAYATVPAGDIPLRGSNNTAGQPYAKTVNDIIGTTSYNLNWETNGYSDGVFYGGAVKTFAGYTTGPRYWGKSFFLWPPDPRPANDWRKKFFFAADGVTPLNDNTKLWNTSGTPNKVPRTSGTTNYYINYAAILRWITSTGPNPFPTQLRAGKISYYTAIPDASNTANDAALNTRFRVTNPTDLNERFWKHYIDFVLGFKQTGSGPVYSNISMNVGYGDDFDWGTRSVTTPPTTSGGTTRYMSYTDNPPRPKTRTWFGPMTMVDFIDNYNEDRRWMPGTAHQAPLWGAKIGMRAAMLDIEKNHPNDYVCLSFFNTPAYSSGDGGKFNRVRSPLGRNYTRMVDSLFFPQPTIDSPGTYPEINCYDTANMLEAPRSGGATCPVMSLMHAYNQFSMHSSLPNWAPPPAPEGEAGGLGRRGAQKMVILMTDGVANTSAHASFTNAGPYQSYYRIRFPGEYPTNSNGSYSSLQNQIYGVAQNICNLDTASTPGYSTARKPVLIHCVAYGSLFDPSVAAGASAARDAAYQILQQVQYIGKTQTSPSTPLQSYKVITGTQAQRVALMQQCYQRIMQDSVSVTLIE